METKTFLWHDTPLDVKKDKDYLFDRASNQKINNRLTENFKEFDQDFIALSISYDSAPIAVSVLQERDLFNGMARILTRFYYDSPFDQQKSLMPVTHNTSVKKISKGLRPLTIDMIKQQIECGRRIGIEDFFVSKEGDKTYLMSDFYKRVVVSLPEYNWQFDTKNKYKMTQSSFQWITWTGENTLEAQDVQ